MVEDDRGRRRKYCMLCGLSCLEQGAGRSVLDKTHCSGEPYAIKDTHGSHHLWVLRPFVFCVGCGGFTAGRGRKLRAACTNRVNRMAKSRLNRMLDGRHPTREVQLGTPVVLARARAGFKATIGGVEVPVMAGGPDRDLAGAAARASEPADVPPPPTTSPSGAS